MKGRLGERYYQQIPPWQTVTGVLPFSVLLLGRPVRTHEIAAAILSQLTPLSLPGEFESPFLELWHSHLNRTLKKNLKFEPETLCFVPFTSDLLIDFEKCPHRLKYSISTLILPIIFRKWNNEMSSHSWLILGIYRLGGEGGGWQHYWVIIGTSFPLFIQLYCI